MLINFDINFVQIGLQNGKTGVFFVVKNLKSRQGQDGISEG